MSEKTIHQCECSACQKAGDSLEKTIRRGQAELAENLENRPQARVRLSGAGRQKVEKKTLKSSKT